MAWEACREDGVGLSITAVSPGPSLCLAGLKGLQAPCISSPTWSPLAPCSPAGPVQLSAWLSMLSIAPENTAQ